MDEKKYGYAIGDMSRLSKVNIETIRFYERIGVMPKPDRTPGGNRQFNHTQLKRLVFIKRCRDLGFSLDEIRVLLTMVDRQDFTCNEVNEMTIAQLGNIRKKLSDLKRLEKTLLQMAATCNKGNIPQCPIIDSLFELS